MVLVSMPPMVSILVRFLYLLKFSIKITFIKEKKLSWRDLYYHCTALDDFYIDMSADLEKLVQSIFKPSLSMR